MAKKTDTESPLMRQHAELKKKFPDAMLLFRVGDFYETFGEDARRASQVLGITLTRKMAGGGEYTDLAGIPYHALEQYLPRLVRAGMRVAICEQLEDPKTAKGLVKRGITELVTPGVAYNDMVLEVKENNFLCGLHLTDKVHGVSFLDVSTGEFFVAQGDINYIDKLLTSFRPSEVVVQRKRLHWFQEHFAEKYYTNTFDDWVFAPDFAHELLLKQFGTASLKGFGVEDLDMGIIAGPVQDPDLLEIPLYHERFLAYVSPQNPAYLQESIKMETLFEQPIWIIRDGLRLMNPGDFKEGEISYDRLFEGGRVGILIQVVNDNGGMTIIPETHTDLILYSQQGCLRPITDPVPSRTISLVVRNDYIHEAKLNVVVDAVKRIIPGVLLDSVIRKQRLNL